MLRVFDGWLRVYLKATRLPVGSETWDVHPSAYVDSDNTKTAGRLQHAKESKQPAPALRGTLLVHKAQHRP